MEEGVRVRNGNFHLIQNCSNLIASLYWPHLTNNPVEDERSLAPAGLRQPLELEAVVHQGGLRAGHQLILVVELTRQSEQALVGPVEKAVMRTCSHS